MYVTRFSSIPSCRISEIDFSLKNVAKIQSIIKDVHISEQSYSKYSSQHAAQSRLESETELSASVYLDLIFLYMMNKHNLHQPEGDKEIPQPSL